MVYVLEVTKHLAFLPISFGAVFVALKNLKIDCSKCWCRKIST